MAAYKLYFKKTGGKLYIFILKKLILPKILLIIAYKEKIRHFIITQNK